jgi:hypothetical protein
MLTETYVDSGAVRSWCGIENDKVGLLLSDESLPLQESLLTLRSDGGVCVFASPPFYSDPEVILVQNWNREIGGLAQRQVGRHAFVGSIEQAQRLGSSPKYADV